MSKETIKVVEINTDPAKKSIKDLRKELMELKNQMANLEEGGDEFLEIANKAGELKHQLDEINESVKGASADFGDMVGNITNVAAGLTGAFQAVAGGLQAMGLESKAIDETIKRMQGLMAVTQGLGSIDTAIKSLNKLQKSITATTGAAKLLKAALQPKVFLAISAAIAGLTFIFNKHKEKQEEVIRAQEEYNKKIQEEVNKKREAQVKDYLDDLNTELRIKRELANIKYGDDELANKKEELKLLRTELNKLGLELGIYGSGGSLVAGEDRVAEMQKRIEAVAAIKTEIAKLEADITVLEATAPARAEAERKRKAEEARKSAEDAAEAEKELAKRRKKNYEDEVKTIEYLITLYKEIYGEDSVSFKEEELKLAERALSNIKSYFGETSEEYKEQLLIVLDLRKALKELTEVKEETLSNEEIELALENDRLKEMAKGWLYNEETAIETFDRISEELKTALDRDLINQTQYDTAVKNLAKERSRYIADQSVKAFASTANFVTTILDGIADQQDQTNKEGFEKSKKLQIASATIQMFTGIATALAGAFTTKTGPWDIALAAIQAATIAASGILNINKIKNTTFDGGGSATPSAGAVNATIVPPVQYSQAVQGAELNGNIQNTKVYVLESEISNVSNAIKTQVDENTY